ncbi:hypothetical protein BWQ96_04973 [Gracilariopsis chorda]|uniref:Uncharacterized protein n=1 Tax=Gracilariopsis chorda TaxID=448386 RepID=A0A2V3IT34_9FLOR|nr:hypothetical protein BWQ96_04973 [Gracilariopsis chorda]|eukprot:PXF45274.1 hypothetical protein BWQ96_04973 [Gracilariopsis chorda]
MNAAFANKRQMTDSVVHGAGVYYIQESKVGESSTRARVPFGTVQPQHVVESEWLDERVLLKNGFTGAGEADERYSGDGASGRGKDRVLVY